MSFSDKTTHSVFLKLTDKKKKPYTWSNYCHKDRFLEQQNPPPNTYFNLLQVLVNLLSPHICCMRSYNMVVVFLLRVCLCWTIQVGSKWWWHFLWLPLICGCCIMSYQKTQSLEKRDWNCSYNNMLFAVKPMNPTEFCTVPPTCRFYSRDISIHLFCCIKLLYSLIGLNNRHRPIISHI